MTLVFMDGFDHYTTNTIAGGKWHRGYAAVTQSGARTGLGCILQGVGSNEVSRMVPTADTYIVGMAVRGETGTDDANVGIQFRWDDTDQVQILWDAANTTWDIYRGGSKVADGTNGVAPIVDDWYYLEARVYVDDVNGEVEVRLDGVAIATFSGDTRNTASGDITNINLLLQANVRVDDLYILDETGTKYNTFLGPIAVQTLFPTANGSLAQFTPSAGSNYENVDDTNPDEDATYNSTNAAAEDTFNFDSLTGLDVYGNEIAGVQITSRARKNNASGHTIRNTIYGSLGTKDQGDNQGLPDAQYIFNVHMFTADPDTGDVWESDAVDALEAGYEVDGV